MILSFRTKNFRSFAEDAIISMRPVRAYKEHWENLHHTNEMDVLKVAAVYGPNASGKSNLVKAIAFMRRTVLDSLRRSSVDKIDVEPFALDEQKILEPSEFDIEMLIGDYVYRYGFSAKADSIVAEWLYRSHGGARSVAQPLFIREGGKILEANKRIFREIGFLDIKTLLSNSLLLPRLDQLNNETAKRIMRWFAHLQVMSGSRSQRYSAFSARKINNTEFHDGMMRFLKFADSSIKDVLVKSRTVEWEKENISFEEHTVLVARMNRQGKQVPFDLGEKESEGTIKMFELSGPLTDILNEGHTLVIDEMEAKLHPLLTKRIIYLFSSKDWNPNNAQLIFITHDATIMRHAGLRRDQIWFCDKNRYGVSDLYSLAEIKSTAKARKEDNLEKKYLEGRFGAVPRFESTPSLFPKDESHESEADKEV